MHISKKQLSDTQTTLTFTLSEADLSPIKQRALKKLGANVKVAGFREGKAPLNIIEKNVDQSLLETEVIEDAVNTFYIQALDEHKIRPVARPDVSIKKFVPYTNLEFETVVSVIGKVALPDYKKIKLPLKKASVTEKDVTEVLDSLRSRAAERKEVKRAAKKGDQATIDFKGTNKKGEAIKGAEGNDYPLILGSNSFIPGFEDKVIGNAADKPFNFDITFPKDYGVKALAGKVVNFAVTIKKVEELIEPVVDDSFAASVGPFKTLADLKRDIKAQLTQERQTNLMRDYEQALIEKIVAQTKLSVPQVLVDEQTEALLKEQQQNILYRGQTWQEFLESEGVSESDYRTKTLAPQAEMRVKAGLVLAEVSDQEDIQITPDELQVRLQLLKGQYQDAAMQAELDKPENQREIGSRMITEKTIEKLVQYASK
ncbi:trigger factor [Candidatus Saccharibacteria bacterium]|nr:trigger factor [Candidatus Saccharibacteria bacterium]